MSSAFYPFSRIALIEPSMNNVVSEVFDPVSSYISHPFDRFFSPISNFNFRDIGKDKPHVISIALGGFYSKDDITMAIDGSKLKVAGKAIKSVKNGNNTRQFEREYQIPDDVDTSTMRSELNNGILYIAFDRKHVEAKKMLEDLSNDQEFRICVNFEGIKPEELSVRIVGSDLIIEGSRKSSCVSQNEHTSSSSSFYVSKTIQLHESVEADKIRAMISDNGLQIFAPKDPSRIKPKERLLEIETQ